MKKTWKDIFEKFNSGRLKKKYSLSELLLLAGHLKSETGAFDLKKWNLETKKIKGRIKVTKGNLLEIGCGTGALLNKFKNNFKIFGVDYSECMLSVAKIAIPKGKFKHLEANQINYKKSFFHVIIIYSALQYFPNRKYLKKVLFKIKNQLKKNGILYIGEIVEKNNQFNFNKFRKEQLTYKEYKKKYLEKENLNLKHLSLNRQEIFNLLKQNFKEIEIFNSIKRGKEREIYRFDVCCKKK